MAGEIQLGRSHGVVAEIHPLSGCLCADPPRVVSSLLCLGGGGGWAVDPASGGTAPQGGVGPFPGWALQERLEDNSKAKGLGLGQKRNLVYL